MTSLSLEYPLPEGYRFSSLAADDHEAVLDVDLWAFPSPHEISDYMTLPSPLDWDRTLGVMYERVDSTAIPVDGALPHTEELVGIHSSSRLQHFPVPGGQVPTAGLTWVGVHPGHRRRGLLNAMIGQHFSRSLDRGEAISILGAAEMAIYGRYGYGVASNSLHLTVPRGAALRDVPGAGDHIVRLEKADEARHRTLVTDLHQRAGNNPTGVDSTINRPGWAGRETLTLEQPMWSDPAFLRGGKESQRIAITERDGEPRGYARFRRSLSWSAYEVPEGTVSLGEVVALDAAAARALWGVLLDLDLMNQVKAHSLAPDDAITQLLVDTRAASPQLNDNLWVRILDLPTALASRRYAADLDRVISIKDPIIPANTGHWRVQASAFGPARCQRTDQAADIHLDPGTLGSAYLGGFSLMSLSARGQIAELTPGALREFSAAFSWPVSPFCSWAF